MDRCKKKILMSGLACLACFPGYSASVDTEVRESLLVFVMVVLLIAVLLVLGIVLRFRNALLRDRSAGVPRFKPFESYLLTMDLREITRLCSRRDALRSKRDPNAAASGKVIATLALMLAAIPSWAQADSVTGSLLEQPGIIITLVLLAIPLFVAFILLAIKANRMLRTYRASTEMEQKSKVLDYLTWLEGDEIDEKLLKRRQSLEYQLRNDELSGRLPAEDKRGIIQHMSHDVGVNFFAQKKRAMKRPNIAPELSRLVLAYISCSVIWLVFGTTVGEYLGMKFVSPDIDQVSWLSFGRLRPVHTNAVFWGWSSLAMLGLGYYVVTIVSNTPVHNLRKGWWALFLINLSVILGTICLMAGINNGGGEYREYVWPVMALFAVGLLLNVIDYLQIIRNRKTPEIYISNWYIVSAMIFTLVIVTVAYFPYPQNGLGETIVQGYYMHQGVGMWFMLFNLGVVYYFLPQQLNKPIYSYSLGILAFWTQILFYTLIGTHHFVFSSIPWWLQTVAIVGSVGMLIPVIAGTTNFLMTFRGTRNKVASSYTLPFYLVGIVFYFTGSFQGTVEAFRFTNLVWHFTDFTVAHSHMTMYGIIAFLLWASVYALVPRLTGKEPSQLLVGVHFWLAFIGLLFYVIPLMMGGTFRGLQWMEGKPFIDSVVLMAPYWLWRAIGGSLMWLSHLVFAYNVYSMIAVSNEPEVTAFKPREVEQPVENVNS